jgi:hypothetical protein
MAREELGIRTRFLEYYPVKDPARMDYIGTSYVAFKKAFTDIFGSIPFKLSYNDHYEIIKAVAIATELKAWQDLQKDLEKFRVLQVQDNY